MIKIIASLLIIAGAVVMIFSIVKFRSNLRLFRKFLSGDESTLNIMTSFHQGLMMFFLVGYIIVLVGVNSESVIFLELMTGVVFFFGAAFVYLENILHKRMLSSIKDNFYNSLSINQALEEEREKLICANNQLTQTEDVTIFALAYQADLRDHETGQHILRTSKYVNILAKQLSNNDSYTDYLTDQYIMELIKSAPLHDIGKVGVPDNILQKDGKFTDTEFEKMKSHCLIGASILQEAQTRLNFRSFLEVAEQLVLAHHEKWDGTGYPYGLKGDKIPLSARIMAVADVYDALRSKRRYKEGFSHEKTCKIIETDSGKHFDPDIVKAFLSVHEEFNRISIKLAD